MPDIMPFFWCKLDEESVNGLPVTVVRVAGNVVKFHAIAGFRCVMLKTAIDCRTFCKKEHELSFFVAASDITLGADSIRGVILRTLHPVSLSGSLLGGGLLIECLSFAYVRLASRLFSAVERLSII